MSDLQNDMNHTWGYDKIETSDPGEAPESKQPSRLPPLEKVRELNTMKIITVNTKMFESRIVETALTLTNTLSEGPYSRPLVATLYKINDERVKGFIPTKVWVDVEDVTPYFNVLYYCTPTLPQAATPFKGDTYLMYFMPSEGDVVEYDFNIRFFMDQVPSIKHKGAVWFVAIFGDEVYDDLIVKEFDND